MGLQGNPWTVRFENVCKRDAADGSLLAEIGTIIRGYTLGSLDRGCWAIMVSHCGKFG